MAKPDRGARSITARSDTASPDQLELELERTVREGLLSADTQLLMASAALNELGNVDDRFGLERLRSLTWELRRLGLELGFVWPLTRGAQ